MPALGFEEWKKRKREARSRPSGRSRLGSAALGLILALFGAGVAWLPIDALRRHGRASGYVALACVLELGAAIVLFGLGMAWQSLRGEPTRNSFFMRGLIWVSSRLRPSTVVLGLCAIGIAAVVVGLVAPAGRDAAFGRELLLQLAALHVQVLFHELGHFWMANACGYRPFRLVGGAFAWTREAARWRAHRNGDWRFLLGGAVFYTVPRAARTWARDLSVVLGGPLATAVLLFACIRLQPLVAGSALLEAFASISATLGWALLVFNLLPFYLGMYGFGTDGHQLWTLLRERRTGR